MKLNFVGIYLSWNKCRNGTKIVLSFCKGPRKSFLLSNFLEISISQIKGQEISSDMIFNILFLNIWSTFFNKNTKLKLMINSMFVRYGKGYWWWIINNTRPWFYEDHWLFRNLCASHLFNMFQIVFADADYFWGWRFYEIQIRFGHLLIIFNNNQIFYLWNKSLHGIPFVFEFMNFVHKLKLNICFFLFESKNTYLYFYVFHDEMNC